MVDFLHARPGRDTMPSSRRIAWLDGWRGLAILSVLAGHFIGAMVPALAMLGGYGVELFFVLSGRLMGQILFVDHHPLPDFFRRRVARIGPGLLVYTTVVALTALFAEFHRPGMQAWEYFSAITFTINYIQALGGEESWLLVHIWSLSVEEHSYTVLALLALAIARRADRAKWILAAAGVLALLNGIRLHEAGAGGVHQVYWRTDVRSAPVFLSAAAYLFLRDARPSERMARMMGYLPLLLLPLSLVLFAQPSITLAYSSSAVLLASGVNLLRYSPAWLLRGLSTRFLTTFGLLSYSIYLWQQWPSRLALEKSLSPWAALPLAIMLGLASYNIVERPARRWINGLEIGRRRPNGGASVAAAASPPA